MKPYLIAELCCNWRDLNELAAMVELAKRCGADAVKVQVFRTEHIADHPRAPELQQRILTEREIERIQAVAGACQLDFIATPFYPECVPWLAGYVDAFKVRFADRNNPHLHQVLSTLDIPWIVSVTHPRGTCFQRRDSRDHFVYVVPEYPPAAFKMPAAFRSYSGWSNHYPSIVPPILAAERGAQVIEMHVQLVAYPEPDGTFWLPFDKDVSLTFSEFKDVAEWVEKLR